MAAGTEGNQYRSTAAASGRWGDGADVGTEERCVARRVEPPADAGAAGEQEVAEAALGVDLAPNGMYWNAFSPALPQRWALTVRIAPCSSMRTRISGCSGGRSKQATMTFSVSARQVTPRSGSTVGGANTRSRSQRASPPTGRCGVVRVEHGHAAEQAALRAASAVGVLVGDAQRRQRPAPDAGLPRERSAVHRLLGGERQPEADLDAPTHRHADPMWQPGAVADRVLK